MSDQSGAAHVPPAPSGWDFDAKQSARRKVKRLVANAFKGLDEETAEPPLQRLLDDLGAPEARVLVEDGLRRVMADVKRDRSISVETARGLVRRMARPSLSQRELRSAAELSRKVGDHEQDDAYTKMADALDLILKRKGDATEGDGV